MWEEETIALICVIQKTFKIWCAIIWMKHRVTTHYLLNVKYKAQTKPKYKEWNNLWCSSYFRLWKSGIMLCSFLRIKIATSVLQIYSAQLWNILLTQMQVMPFLCHCYTIFMFYKDWNEYNLAIMGNGKMSFITPETEACLTSSK